MKSIKQVAWTIGEQGFSSITFFIITMLLARAVSKEEFGLYILGLTLIMISQGFQGALITTPYAILYHNHKNNNKGDEFTKFSFYMQHAFIFIFSILFMITAIYFYLLNEELLMIFTFFLYLYFIGYSYYFFNKSLLITQFNIKNNFIFCILIYTMSLFIMFIFYYKESLSINLALSIFGVTSLFISVIFINITYKQFYFNKISCLHKSAFFKENWDLGKWMIGSNFAFIFSIQVFPWLLLFFWDLKSVAELGVVLGATRILTPAIQGLSSFLLPKLTQYTHSIYKFKNIFTKIFLLTQVTSIILVLIGFFYGNIIIELLYSSKYENLGILITLGFLIQGLNIINMPIKISLNAFKRTDIGFISLMLGAFIALTIGVFLTWKFNVLGALLGILVSTLVSMIYRYIELNKILKKV